MSSDSSDDENLDLLREAADSQFINDSMFQKSEDKEPILSKETTKLPPSLRVQEDEDDQFKLFKVTPQFQNYVAKALSRKLEEYLKTRLKEYPSRNEKQVEMLDCIKLLNSSRYPISTKDMNEDNSVNKINYSHCNRLKKYSKVIDESELKSVVITGEDILNFKEQNIGQIEVRHLFSNTIKTKEEFFIL
ncbi:hypothetical protein HHI36_021747 [Cryptolaemus montrouzieri]|uniref:Protein CUSTOS n=1 Tax=Cryptolaemus montrouzieri TaxID=559131 RepID=A0ABD2MYJ8_9CUCU